MTDDLLARRRWTWLSGLIVTHAYMWSLIPFILVNAGEQVSPLPFAGVPLAILWNLWLGRRLKRHIESNDRLSPHRRRAWRRRLTFSVPFAAAAYIWSHVR